MSGLLPAYVVTAGVDTWLAGLPRGGVRSLRWLTKPTLMPLLAAAMPPRGPAAGVALAGAWGGDVALMAEEDPRAFRAGVLSFALAHGAYAVALAPDVDPARLRRSRRVRVLAAGALVASAVAAGSAGRVGDGLAAPVAGYVWCVAGTAAVSEALGDDLPPDARRMLAAGGLVFLASDTVLGVRTLLSAADPTMAPGPLERVVMATYTSAQLLLTAGLRRLP